ncbi:TPA: hypothetical protein HA239_05495 [Candidatus Woesearchaeota archaeon]|nr:hypothetical protein QT06_C0001G1269 [archaeon GW2011_AR15]MBS3104269.1 VIT1/CCC1 transporter family protein [Candidatus Woesearchaeota archaeon]HIH41835.1 hypothetical protein [Candidatus Woesearchaeota archaeon]
MADKRVKKAQEAYEKGDIESTKKVHTKDAIEHAENHKTGKHLGDFVYGALDGIVTTFAVVSGVEGAQLSSSIILILGFANLLGDGVSMGVGNYLSTKSELDYIKKERKREEWEIENYPEGEKMEIRHIFHKKGFRGKDLDRATGIVTSDKKIWVDTMMTEELGLVEEEKTPVISGLATFTAFVIAGFIPLLAFVLKILIPSLTIDLFMVSIFLTGLALFVVGAMRSLVTRLSWLRSGLEMLFVGGITALVAYGVGFFLRGLGV